jgi:hypothetical protein
VSLPSLHGLAGALMTLLLCGLLACWITRPNNFTGSLLTGRLEWPPIVANVGCNATAVKCETIVRQTMWSAGDRSLRTAQRNAHHPVLTSEHNTQ